jgi:5,10-methylenetetrahydrofolate reductase
LPAVAGFAVVVEVEPATHPDLRGVRHQVALMSDVATAFLVPDNHLGRATVSSLAVAREITAMGERAIACVNARDRNRLGFRRDLLTAATYGVDEFLFVHGDRPETGTRSDDVTVHSMLDEARRFHEATVPAVPWRIGVATGLRGVPAWKLAADALFVQVGFDVDALVAWRRSVDFDGPVYAGVIVLASAAMARRLASVSPELAVPEPVVGQLDRHPDAGLDLAMGQIAAIREAGCFDGVHVVPVTRYREMRARLGAILDG